MDNRDNIYNLPWQTEEILIKQNPTRDCENLGLLLDKYVPKHVFEKPDREKPQTGKTAWLFNILKPRDKTENQNNHTDPDFAKHAYDRWDKMTGALGAEPFNALLPEKKSTLKMLTVNSYPAKIPTMIIPISNASSANRRKQAQ